MPNVQQTGRIAFLMDKVYVPYFISKLHQTSEDTPTCSHQHYQPSIDVPLKRFTIRGTCLSSHPSFTGSLVHNPPETQLMPAERLEDLRGHIPCRKIHRLEGIRLEDLRGHIQCRKIHMPVPIHFEKEWSPFCKGARVTGFLVKTVDDAFSAFPDENQSETSLVSLYLCLAYPTCHWR